MAWVMPARQTSTMIVHIWRRVRRYWLPSRTIASTSSHLLISFKLDLTLIATVIERTIVPTSASIVSIRYQGMRAASLSRRPVSGQGAVDEPTQGEKHHQNVRTIQPQCTHIDIIQRSPGNAEWQQVKRDTWAQDSPD